MTAIFKKELASYFHSAKGYAFIAINVLFIGAFCAFYNFYYGSTRLELVISLMTLVVALTAPIITMKSFSAERDACTEQLLFSLPFSSRDIVFGKYLSALALAGFEVCLLLIIPPVFSIFGTVNFASAYSAILGFVLFILADLAICFFIACVSKNTLVAGIISYAVTVVFFAMGLIPIVKTSALLDSLTSTTKVLAFFEVFDNFVKGLFDLGSILYYISITVIFLFLTLRSVEKRRLGYGGKR